MISMSRSSRVTCYLTGGYPVCSKTGHSMPALMRTRPRLARTGGLSSCMSVFAVGQLVLPTSAALDASLLRQPCQHPAYVCLFKLGAGGNGMHGGFPANLLHRREHGLTLG